MIRVVKEIKRAHELEEKTSNIPSKKYHYENSNEDYVQEKGSSNDYNNISEVSIIGIKNLFIRAQILITAKKIEAMISSLISTTLNYHQYQLQQRIHNKIVKQITRI